LSGWLIILLLESLRQPVLDLGVFHGPLELHPLIGLWKGLMDNAVESQDLTEEDDPVRLLAK